MLKIKDLTVSVEDKTILNKFNLTINIGEIHILFGPNGVGKSTIGKVIMNSEDYNVSGSILYNEKELLELNTNEIAKEGVFYLSQNPIAIEGVTNAEMLRTILSEHKRVNLYEFNKKLEELCKKLDIPKSFIHREINMGMSGGERKKNELLHLWMLEPSFVIIDEVDSGLDVDALKVVMKSVKEYQTKYKASILFITHNPAILNYLKPDKVHVLNNDSTLETGDISLVKKIEEEGFND